MKQEDKKLLLIDLCGRLPYGVKVLYQVGSQIPDIKIFDGKQYEELKHCSTLDDWLKCTFKPYLFPLSSMKGKHRAELFNIRIPIEDSFQDSLCEIDFYHRNHFDYRGLIEKGLAIDATGLNIY